MPWKQSSREGPLSVVVQTTDSLINAIPLPRGDIASTVLRCSPSSGGLVHHSSVGCCNFERAQHQQNHQWSKRVAPRNFDFNGLLSIPSEA
jgi:hypothetical protein